MPKELLRDRKQHKRLAGMTFNVMNPEEIKRCSSVKVYNRDLYKEHIPSEAAEGGLLDPRLGNIAKEHTALCVMCNQNSQNCMGHYGHLDLLTEVVHVGYENHLLRILQCICKYCSRVLLNQQQREKLTKYVYQRHIQYTVKKTCWRLVVETAKKCHTCYYCGKENGVVKKGNLCYFIYDEYRFAKKEKLQEMVVQLQNMDGTSEELLKCAKKGVVLMFPDRVHSLLEAIPATEVPFLFMGMSRPQDLLWSRVLIPPNNIRPVVRSQQRKGTNQDDLTCCLQNVLTDNDKLYTQFGNVFEELTANLGVYINSGNARAKAMLPDPKAVPRRCLTQRIKGKQGRFRGNLSGKRTNFTMRSVISPDPNCAIDEVVIPLHVARTLTFPEMVTPFNLTAMKELVRRGNHIHPGANEVVVHQGGGAGADEPPTAMRFALLSKKISEDQARRLKPGDIVERHIRNGDVVLFNRQPSLHRVSIMAFRAVIREGLTLRFNECCCAPFNADFDGDEMNIHFPQSLEAKAECAVIMHSAVNICSPKNGDPLIAPTQDFITGSYLMTHKDTFLTLRQVLAVVGSMCAKQHTFHSFRIPPPAILKPQRLWTGKQVFNVILNPNPQSGILVNVRCSSKLIYTDRGQEFCAKDGFVYIRRGELLAGTLDKKSLGNGCKQGLFYAIYRDFGPQAHADTMWRLCRTTAAFIMEHGFTIGADDVVPTTQMAKLKVDKLREGYVDFYSSLENYVTNRLARQPGCDLKTTFENLSNKQLSSIRDALGKCALDTMSTQNPVVIMATCGSKGSVSNLSQMAGCVGQQIVNGQRIMDGLQDRTTPHFSRFALFPEAKGFCKNSFFSGLSPHEYVFHTVSGREGLVDTAVKTAQTGYMQRRIIKGLEDCVVEWDYTVRTHRKEVVQFIYGSDNIDPNHMETTDLPTDLDRAWLNAITNFQFPEEEQLTPVELEVLIAGLKEELKMCNDAFITAVGEKLKWVQRDQEQFRQVMRLPRDHNPSDVCEDVWLVNRVTRSHVGHFLTTCQQQFIRCRIEPCSPVGAIACQSVGEPATQMTLKTFHFAGVASMNITQGVPRMQELIDGSEAKTAMITVRLRDCTNPLAALKVRSRAKATSLEDICRSISATVEPMAVFVLAVVDWERVKALHLELDLEALVHAIQSVGAVKSIKVSEVYARSNNEVCIVPTDLNKCLQLAEEARRICIRGSPLLTNAVIQSTDVRVLTITPHREHLRSGLLTGKLLLQTVNQFSPLKDVMRIQLVEETEAVRIIFQKKLSLPQLETYCGLLRLHVMDVCRQRSQQLRKDDEDEDEGTTALAKEAVFSVEEDAKHYELFFEGKDYRRVLATPGVDAEHTLTNNVPDVLRTLGVEAARAALIRELATVMQNHGVEVNIRHVMLLVDRMTYGGRIDGYQRNSIAKMKESALSLASFELALNHLYEAAFHGQKDELTGVSESVIVGNMIPLGTGMFQLVEKMSDLHFQPRATLL